jgi:hypothetical protein
MIMNLEILPLLSLQKNIEGKLISWEYLNGTELNWITKSYNLSKFFNGSCYVGFYYRTNDSGIGEGFYVDNIEITVDGETILDDDGTNESWRLYGFTRENDTIPPVINNPDDIQIEQDYPENITWVVTETSGMYKVLKDSTEVVSLTPYTNGEELKVPIDTSALGTWYYTIIVNGTSGNEVSDEVKIPVQKQAPPTINITYPIDGYSTTSSSVDIIGVVDGTGSTPTVTVNNKTVEVTPTDGYAGTFSVSVSLSIGDNLINANVTDAA